MARTSLHEFARQSWPLVEGGRQFVDNWHIGAICEHLEATIDGEIQNLIIGQPPRCMKSTLLAVMFPAWAWIEHPELQFLYTSYAQNLSMRDSVKCRRLMESAWFQNRWGNRFAPVGDSNTKLRFDNDKTGYRISTSVDGMNTGEGGDFLCADDPNSAKDLSDTILTSTNNWWDQVMTTRLNDQKTGRKIVQQQRLHENDLTGHILGKGDSSYVHLMLPMEFETARRCVTVVLPSTKGAPWRDPRTKEGELLWPARFGDKEVKKIKHGLGSEYAIAGQLQMRPAPAEGGIIKKTWFPWWKQDVPPKIEYVIESWDTAMEVKDTSSYSACTVWGLWRDEHMIPNIILLNMWRGKEEYPELRRKIKDMAEDYRMSDGVKRKDAQGCRPDVILMEGKANAISLIQDLSRAGVIVTRFDPTKFGDKMQRVRVVTHILEAKRVWLPAMPPLYTSLRPYADICLENFALFPNAQTRDLVDTMTQALLRLNITGWVWLPGDPDPQPASDPGLREAFY